MRCKRVRSQRLASRDNAMVLAVLLVVVVVVVFVSHQRKAVRWHGRPSNMHWLELLFTPSNN